MAPLVEAFHPAELPARVQRTAGGKQRKPAVDLAKCELKEMIQYDCDLNGAGNDPRTKVVCEPVLRLFRRCADGLTVETTGWEGLYNDSNNNDNINK